jgi:hypothetical protein
LDELVAFAEAFKTSVPLVAQACLDDFITGERAQVIRNETPAREARAGIVFLIALESEISYHLSSREERIRARSDRAFLHLQRLIAVDPDARTKWKGAFDNGETHLEAFGAVHLLWHGIWAFKINAERARTDLIFNDPIEETFDQRGIDGLVLTEWKKLARSKSNSDDLFRQARIQTELYTAGSLAGIELAGYRYAIVVSEKELPKVPDDLRCGDVIYRHINIVVDPRIPSSVSRK